MSYSSAKGKQEGWASESTKKQVGIWNRWLDKREKMSYSSAKGKQEGWASESTKKKSEYETGD